MKSSSTDPDPDFEWCGPCANGGAGRSRTKLAQQVLENDRKRREVTYQEIATKRKGPFRKRVQEAGSERIKV